ncbi:MAG: Uma2 family endonuclease [Actinomycetota bacterium]
MSAPTEVLTHSDIVYPDDDGQPMSENTLQFEWITMLQGNLDTLFLDRPDVFVAGDLLWYPVEGEPAIRVAPDVMVAFGRPKGYRGSYRQWEEGGVPPQVVFEVISPGNTILELFRKLRFYEQRGVEECYYLDPAAGSASGWRREGPAFVEIAEMNGWVSTRLGIHFQVEEGRLTLLHADGEPFHNWTTLARERNAERQRAEAERQRAEAERQRAEAERQRANRLEARLRELGLDPDAD